MQDQIPNLLEAHRLWLESGKTAGQPADFSNIDLTNTDFANADLRLANFGGLNLIGAKFDNAQLQSANFAGAELESSSFRGALLNRADFRDAHIRYGDFSNATGLISSQFRGADLSGTILPDSVEPESQYRDIEKALAFGKGVFMLHLSACIYCVLTIISTNDVSLLTNSSSLILPGVSTPIPTTPFYWIAPWILLFLFIHMLLYHEKIWSSIANMPAVFPNGTSLDQALPWFVLSIGYIYFPRMKLQYGRFEWLRRLFSNLCVWFVLPVVLIAFWHSYLVRRSIPVSQAQVAALGISLVLGYIFRDTIRERISPGPMNRNDRQRRKRDIKLLGLLSITFGFFLTSVYAITNDIFFKPANFEGMDVSQKPKTWNPKEPNYEDVVGAELSNLDLRGVQAQEAFLAKANLTNTNLSHGKLYLANLRFARFQKTKCIETELENAELQNAVLTETSLVGANLRSAHFEDSVLREVDFSKADLTKARFDNAKMQGVILQVKNKPSSENTILSFAQLPGANLADAKAQGVLLNGANLENAILVNGDFRYAILSNAKLKGAILARTDLRGADLSGVEDLTRAQIRTAIIDKKTRLPKTYLENSMNE